MPHPPNRLGSNLRLRVLVGLLAFAGIPLLTHMVTSVRATLAPPTPQGQTSFIRQIQLSVNDLVYNPTTQMLYGSVPSSVGPGGNSIISVNPATGAAGTPTFVGSEPKKLALSSDGNSLYVFLDGAAAIRRFDIPSQTAGLQFALGQDNFFGSYTLSDMAVAPGNPNLLAVARSYRGVSPPQAGVAVFDNGVQLPTTTPGHTVASDFLAFSASATTLYGGGLYSGLNTMTINANGVSITSTKTFAAGSAIRFDNGRVYGSTGHVIDPITGNLAGTFSGVGSGPFTTDSGVGRAYFITNSQSSTNYTVTLRAFNVSTFLSEGTLEISGVNGHVTSLVRWGSNGLAFRTDGGQLFLIQTALVPSADPIPSPTPTVSPTPTPSPTPFATFVRQVPLVNNDIAFSPTTQMFYAAVPSSVGSGGNSIRPVDPTNGTTGSSVFVGSEPMKLAMADDGQTMFVALDGAAAVRRVNVTTQVVDPQFALGQGSFTGPVFANDLAVLPGNPNAVAVSRFNKVSSPSSEGIAVYDNGVRRTKTTANSTFYVETSTNPNRLYSGGFGGGVDRLSLDGTGVTYVDTVPMINGGDIRFENGLIYGSNGGVLDPEAKIMKGSFTGFGFGGNNIIMTTDAANGRAFFLITSGTSATLRAYDINTFTPIGLITFSIPSGSSAPSRLLRWGTNGLAFRVGSHVIFVQTALVNSSGSVPSPTPTPSPTPSPSPPYIPTFIRAIDLPANDLVYRQANQTLYASVPSIAGANGNSITGINPANGVIGASVFVGSEPNRLALSDDNHTLHISLDGAAAIRTFDLQTQVAGTQFSWGTVNQRPADMAVVPGSPQALATTDGTGVGVAIYDNGVARANKSKGGAYGISSIAFGSPTILYGYDSYSSGFELVKLNVDSNGVSGTTIANNLISGFAAGLQFANGRLYSSTGRVVDPVSVSIAGTFIPTSSFTPAFTVDSNLHRAFFLTGSGGGTPLVLTAFDTDTFLPIGSVTLSGAIGQPGRLVRWGSNGLAFSMANSFGSTEPRRLFIIQSELVSNAAPVPTGIQLTLANYHAFEGSPTINVVVSRTGDASQSVTVDYATSDGTALAGSDYTASSGTLTFAAGQLSRTIPINVTNDTLYEGANETFNITLSNPGGGAVLTSFTSATVTISDNDQKPVISIPSTNIRNEGNTTAVLTFAVNLSNPSVQTLTVDYATANGTASAGSDFVATSGTLTFAPGTTSQLISVTVNGDTTVEPDETFSINLSNATNASFILGVTGIVTLANDDTSVQLSAASYSVNEADGFATITVTRLGLLTGATTVRFATSDTAGLANCATVGGPASERCDYTTSLGMLTFTSGQNSKTFTVPITNDVLVEGNETFSVTLLSPTNALLPGPSTAPVTIVDNDTSPATANPIDGVDFFILQQYRDILGRQPDQTGFQNWVNTLANCPNGGFGEPPTSNCDRLHVAAGFFQSDEFLNRGYWAFRFYMVAFNQRPSYAQFIPDMSQVGGPKSPAEEETSKVAFADAFVQRPEFVSRYGSLSGQALADALLQTAGLPAGSYQAGSQTNGQILRGIAQSQGALDKFLAEGTVSILYFGFQRRDPDATGYQNNVNTLNADPNNLRHMIFIFIYSTEYRGRFGPT